MNPYDGNNRNKLCDEKLDGQEISHPTNERLEETDETH